MKTLATMRERIGRVVLAGVLFWLPAIAFFKLADGVREQEAVRADSSFLEWLHGFASPGLDRLAIFVTTLGNASTVLVITGCVAAYFLYKKSWRQLIFFCGSIGGAAAADAILKIVFHRARPSLWSPVIKETDYSFPSGHATITAALALSVIYLLWKTRWRWLAIILGAVYVVTVGLSRLYLGVHFPTDILAGWSASLIWVSIAAWASGVNKQSQ